MIDFTGAYVVAADRPDFEALCCMPVALPFWRLRLRLEVLTRRPISPLHEFTLRAASEIDTRLSDIRRLLGIDERTFKATVAGIVEQEWATVYAGSELRLTALGKEVAEAAFRERSESRVINLDYDGLVRGPTLLDLPVEPQQRRALGLREVPGNPATPPDLVELQDNFTALQGIVRRFGDAREQTLELLAVKGVLRRERIYREAVLLVLASGTGQLQVAPIVEGVLDDRLERRLADADVRRQLRLPPDLRRSKRHNALLPAGLLEQYDADADREARRLRLAAAAHADPESPDAKQASDAAALATGKLRLRKLLPHEHPRLLWSVLKSAVDRILIATPRITNAVADRELLRTVESALNRGVTITVITGAEEEQLPAWLPRLAADSELLSIHESAELSASTLVRDSSLALVTTFPILAYYGAERPWRDERGWLLSTPEYVDPVAEPLLRSYRPN